VSPFNTIQTRREEGKEGGGREGGKKGEKIKFSVSKHYTVQYATMLTSQWW